MEVNFVGLNGEPLERGGLFDQVWMLDDDDAEDARAHGDDVEDAGAAVDVDAHAGRDDGVEDVDQYYDESPEHYDEQREYQVLLRPKVQRGRKAGIPDHVLEAVERQERTKTETILTPFGDKEFASFGAFHLAWQEYEGEQWLNYRIRDAATAAKHNATMATRKTMKREPVPDHMEFGTRTYRCTHGLYQPTRSKGIRHAKATRYTACDARIVVEARRSSSPSNPWVCKVVSEVVRHNHICSKTVYDSYSSASADVLGDADLFRDLHLMIQVGASTARIRDVIRMRHGTRLTAQDIRNFMRDRLGGRSALANLRLLLQRFASFEGSRLLIIEDEDGLVCGIVLQSRAQRMFFERFGDNLLLDWTHNTNNAGYYLGALMATSASGSGVSVLDFLCLAQTKDMMRTVFAHFLSWNPGAAEKIRSIVIDKDYVEWVVLTELFQLSRILLCQFHVIKWLVQVIQEGRYGRLSVPMQDSVIAVVRAMVYSATQEEFAAQKWLLEHMLRLECPAFLKYMDERWYSCSDMWADCERGTVFTATNTTTNRLESSWGQVKAILGLKLRFDMCLEAVFTYQTAVLEREIETIESIVGPTSLLRSRSDRFIRPVLAQVSDYCTALIDEQYAAHLHMIGSYFVTPEVGSSHRFVVERVMASGAHRVVDTSDWSCSCSHFVTSELPCRHIIFFSRAYARHEFLPLAVLRQRWMLTSAVNMLDDLRACAAEVQSLRTGLLLVEPTSLVADAVQREVDGDDADDGYDADLAFLSIQSAKSKKQSASVAHVRLARGEVAARVVLDNLEKRNVVNAEFQEIMTFMMAQSSPRFKSMAAYLREMLDGLLVAFKEIPLTEEDRMEEAISAAMARCVLSPQDQIRAMVNAEVEVGDMKARRPVRREGYGHQHEPDYVHIGHDLGVVGCHTQVGGVTTESGTSACWPATPASTPAGEAAATSAAYTRGRSVGDDTPPAVATREDKQVDEDDVSSLDISCVSVVLQDAAVRHADDLASECKPPRVVYQPIPYPVSTTGAASAIAASVDRRPILSAAATKRSATVAGLAGGILEKVILRVPLSGGHSKTQRARGKLKGSKRVAHVTQKSHSGVDLDAFVHAVRAFRGVASAHSKLKEYPLLFNDDWLQKREVVVDSEFVRPSNFSVDFVIPIALLHRFEIAIKAVKESRPPPFAYDLNAPTVSDQLVARIEAATTVRGFSEENVQSFRAFYEALKSCEAYVLDVAWVSQYGPELPAEVRDSVMASLEQSALDTRFHLGVDNENPPTSIALSDVVGRLAGNVWLNDSVLVFVMRQIADGVDGVLIQDCLRPVLGREGPLFQVPSRRLADHQLVVFPVNVSKSHWCQICVTIDVHEGISVVFYDPLALQSNIVTLRDEWVQHCEPLVSAWCFRDLAEYGVSSMEILTTPRQASTDKTSCGIYCIATVCDFALRSTKFREMDTLEPQLISQLRLSFLRSLLCASVSYPAANEEWAAGVMAKLGTNNNSSLNPLVPERSYNDRVIVI